MITMWTATGLAQRVVACVVIVFGIPTGAVAQAVGGAASVDTVAAPTKPVVRSGVLDDAIRLQFLVPAATGAFIGPVTGGCMLGGAVLLAGTNGVALLSLNGTSRWERRWPIAEDANEGGNVVCGAERGVALRSGERKLYNFDLHGTMHSNDLPSVRSARVVSLAESSVLVVGLDARGNATLVSVDLESGAADVVHRLPVAQVRGDLVTAGGRGYFLVGGSRQTEIRAYDFGGRLMGGVTWLNGTNGPAEIRIDHRGNPWVRVLPNTESWSLLLEGGTWMGFTMLPGFRPLQSTPRGELGVIDSSAGPRVVLVQHGLPGRRGTSPF
jgi:hypothetical protein